MLVFKDLFYYHILLEVKVEASAEYFSRSKKRLPEISNLLMKMAYIMLSILEEIIILG
jgi:hypothetical protein